MRYPGFPLARRPVDQEPADPVRRLHRERRDARRGLAPPLRYGGEFRQGQAGAGALGAGEPLSRRRVPALVTQNIDNLHQASGIAPDDVVELHGNTTYAVCLECDQRYELSWVKQNFEAAGRHAPNCRCGGYIKTATVSFGQAMPADAMQRAEQLTKHCDLFLAIGSSLVVWPAAGFPLMAKRNGAAGHTTSGEPLARNRTHWLVNCSG